MKRHFYNSIVFAILFVLSTPALSLAREESKTNNSSSSIYFLENKGRITDQNGNKRTDIDYSIATGDVTIYIGDGAIHYQWAKQLTPTFDQQETKSPEKMMEEQQAMMNAPTVVRRMDVQLIGANINAPVVTTAPQPYFESYLLRSGEEVTLHTYQKITYRNVYPNIDWVLYTNGTTLKYDFVVHQGGKASDIKIKYNGADKIAIEDGALIASTNFGTITEAAPYTYSATTQQEIGSKYILNENELSFNIAPHTGEIVIDPTLEWATYYGGNQQEWSHASATDLAGNVYMGGWTYSTNNIATTGAFQDTLTPNSVSNYYNGFLVKFNVNGVRQWGTYYPGHVASITCDQNGNVYFTGGIDSVIGFATSGAHQDTFGGRGVYTGGYYHGDAFVAKFTGSGQRTWATFYGGNQHDRGTSIALDVLGNVYIGGSTNSPNNIATTGAFRSVLPANPWSTSYWWGHAGFIAKFSNGGARQWATYHNGMISDIDLDALGNIYACGTTWYDTGVATVGAHQTTHSNGGSNGYEGFLAKFSNTGARQWATYYGGNSYDWAHTVDCDAANNVYISGMTFSSNNIASNGAFQTSHAGSYDAFLVKFNSFGNRQWGTYFGGTGQEYGSSMVITPQDKIFISGSTLSTSGIATTDGYKTSNSGNWDDYIAEFTTWGARAYATFYGGPSQEYSYGGGWGGGWGNGGGGLSYNYTGRLHLASSTASTTGIATSGAHQTSANSSYDAYMATFVIDTIAYFIQPFADSVFCPGDTVRIPYGVSYNFKTGNTFTVQLSSPTGSFAAPLNIGSRTDSLADTITCVIPTTVAGGTGYRMRIVSTNPVRTSVDNLFDIKITAPPTLSASNNGPLCPGDTLQLSTTASSTAGVTWSWTGPNGYSASTQNATRNPAVPHTGDYIVTATTGNCSSTDTTTVIINPTPPKPTASSNSIVCPNTTLNLTAVHSNSSATFDWTGPASFTSTTQNPSISNATTAMAGTYSVTVTVLGCKSQPATTNVVVAITTPTPQANSNTPICAGQPLNLTASIIPNATYDWGGPALFSSTAQNPIINNTLPNKSGKYYVKATVNGCVSLTDTVDVVINPAPTIGIFPTPSDSICVGGSAIFTAITNNAGANPTYTWQKNGTTIAGANSPSYTTSNIATGDVFTCLLVGASSCAGHIVTSNPITMVVRPIVQPTVSITASPGTLLEPYELVTFTATTTYAGPSPTFQWFRNGQPVQGATNATWGTYQLSNGDSIKVKLFSSDPCTQPKEAESNTIGIGIKVGIDNINALAGVTLFPNPNNGTFTVKGKVTTQDNIRMSIINSVGQVVHQQNLNTVNGQLNQQINTNNLASGVYLLQLQTGEHKQHIRFTIN
ncbi:MAG: T9SS type A sorting domain-containing protein [Flavipsychrobacter sp.]